MSRPVLILRPEPGASATAERARRLGLDPRVAPLFTIRPLAWDPPDPARFEAVLLTSAKAARHGGAGLQPFTSLPCYVVGEATAEAARAAGFADIRVGPGDGAAAAAMMAAEGVRRAVHPCGRHLAELGATPATVEHLPVYAADAVDALPAGAQAAIEAGALVLVHSPRAGALLADLVKDRGNVRIAAISRAAADAAGEGWGARHVAAAPRDDALLELAAKLCQTEGHDDPS